MEYGVRAYTVREHEETACPICGFTLDLGDRACEITLGGDPVESGLCSRKCAGERVYELQHRPPAPAVMSGRRAEDRYAYDARSLRMGGEE